MQTYWLGKRVLSSGLTSILCKGKKSVVSATQFYPLRLERHNYNRQNQLCLQDNSLVCHDKFCNTVAESTMWFARIPFLNEWVVNWIANRMTLLHRPFVMLWFPQQYFPYLLSQYYQNEVFTALETGHDHWGFI